jgi:hypothetical protein
MERCEQCKRPQGVDWQACGWCGHQAHARAHTSLLARMRGAMLALQAVGLLVATVTLGVLWALEGWTAERGQTLGLIWIGVLLALAFIARSAAGQESAMPTEGESHRTPAH